MDCPDCGSDMGTNVVERKGEHRVDRKCPNCGKELKGGKVHWDNVLDALRDK